MNEERKRKKELKKKYKELKKLYKPTYGIAKNRSNEVLKKEYKELFLNIDATISVFIRDMEKIPKYDEAKDEEILKKWGIESIIHEQNQLDSEVYDHFLRLSDKELELKEKNLKKQLNSFKNNDYETLKFAKEYVFIRKKLHYRNEMNKAVGINVYKLYNQYAPMEARAEEEAKKVFIEHQTKVEQLNEDQPGEYVANNAFWTFKSSLSRSDSDRKVSESFYYSIEIPAPDNHNPISNNTMLNNLRSNMEHYTYYPPHHYEVIDRPNSYMSVKSNDSGYETPIQSTEHTSANGVEMVNDVKRKDTIYNKLYEDKDQLALRLGYDTLKGRSVSSESINHADKKPIEIVMNRAEEEAKKQARSREFKHYLTVRNGKESLA